MYIFRSQDDPEQNPNTNASARDAPTERTYSNLQEGIMEKNKLREHIEQAKMGNYRAMDSLSAEYKQQVLGACRSMIRDEAEAERVTAETFRTAFDRLGELDNPGDFLPWVTQIAREKCGGMRVSAGTSVEKKTEKRLSSVGKSGTLQKAEGSGALSADVIYPQNGQAAPAKKKSKAAGIIVAVSALLVLALAAGVAVLFAGRDRVQPVVSAADAQEDYAQIPAGDAFRAYADYFGKNYSVDDDKVLFCDVTNDGQKEMLVIECPNEQESYLYIYTASRGRVREILSYNVDEYGTLESMGVVGLCEYKSKQCIYERLVYGWTESGGYDETIFYLNENGEREVLAYWNQYDDPKPLDTGEFHFTDFDEIRRLGMWAGDAFGRNDRAPGGK